MYNVDSEKKKVFLKKLFQWHKKNYRNFSWRQSRNPYHILLAEIMLQKTDANKVEKIFNLFIKKYPSPKSLSKARLSQIQGYFDHLGIRKRASRVKDLSKDLVNRYNSTVPMNIKELKSLPGVGDYISNAVLCFSLNKNNPLIDTNFIRILDRVFSIRSLKSRARTDNELWKIIANIIPKNNGREFNLAILDFAALVCKARNPDHKNCPMKEICSYYKILV